MALSGQRACCLDIGFRHKPSVLGSSYLIFIPVHVQIDVLILKMYCFKLKIASMCSSFIYMLTLLYCYYVLVLRTKSLIILYRMG